MVLKSTFFRVLGSILCLSAVGFSAACGEAQAVQAKTLNFVKEDLTLLVGETQNLKYSISPKSAKDNVAYWYSSNETIAYVRNGNVIGVSAGKANISLNVGGLQATCKVTVIDQGGGGDTESIVLSTSTLNLKEGDSATLKAYVNPVDSKVNWSTSNEAVATVNGNGLVSGVAAGSAVITAELASGLSAKCNVNVTKEEPGPTPTPGGDTGWTGTIVVGAPLAQKDFMTSLLDQFNKDTKSTVNFQITQWEEDKGPDNFTQVLSEGPDIFPYVSDQTVRFYQRNALAELPSSSKKFIKDNMGSQALNYATLSGSNKVIGYPFASDNGYIMFYSKRMAEAAGITDMSDITIEELLEKATAKNYEIDYNVGGGFYAAGTLMSYNGGESMYKLTMKAGSSAYSVSSSFSQPNGLKAAQMIKKVYGYKKALFAGEETPGTNALATITDCSKVTKFKNEMGDDYACCPLPYTDASKTSRIAVYLGYKFYGINPGRAGTHIELAHAVAKYLCDESAQRARFNELTVRPTLTSLQEMASSEPHVKALMKQEEVKGTVPLTAVDSSLWSNAATSVLAMKALTSTGEQLDKDLQAILDELDITLTIE